jgi:L-ascorbate 6-phosphate lactonase
MNLRDQIFSKQVPPRAMTMWWLGQSSFICKSPGGATVALDPYLTNSCKAIGEQIGFNMDRMVPPPLSPAELVGIDLYAMTHSHQDHLDPDTVAGYRAAGGTGPFLAPAETVEKLTALGVPPDSIVMTWPNKVYTNRDLRVQATFAIPFGGDDLTHVGYLVSVENGPKVYFTGDTAFHELLAIAMRPHKPDILVAVINGAFRNLSPAEAARLARELDVKVVIPSHHDLFPDNSQAPHMLQTNLKIEGIGDRYKLLEHGLSFTFPSDAG